MPNLYTYYQNGTFEGSSGADPLFKFSTHPSGTVIIVGNWAFSTDVAQAGTKSFKLTANQVILGSNSNRSARSESFFAGPSYPYFSANKIILTVGKKYKFSCYVRVPSGTPIASLGALITLQENNYQGFGHDALYQNLSGGRIRVYHDPGNIESPANAQIEYVGVKVADAIDQWVKIEATFTFQNVLSFGIWTTLFKWNILEDGSQPWCLDLTAGGTVVNSLLNGGNLYVDSFDLVEIVACNLAPSAPAYTKTDETAVDANNGTVTANFTSAYTIEYSLDNVTFQLSPFFENLAPGSYTLYVRDTFGCVATPVPFTIQEFNPPPDPPDPPTGPLTIDQEPINRYNFIEWFNATGPVDNFTDMILENCCWDIPKGYDRRNKKPRIHAPVVAPLEEFAFYINSTDPVLDPEFSIWRLGLINVNGLVHGSIGTLQRSFLDETNAIYNVYASSCTIPGGTAPGLYWMAIYRNDNGAVVYLSNIIEVMALADAKCETVRLQFKNGINMYRYFYELIPTYINKIRLRMYRIDEQPDGDLTQYRAVSTGVLRNVSFELDKFIVLECYYFDDEANRAMMVFQAHGFITVNNKFYLLKSLFKWTFDPSKNCMKGTIEMYEQGFSSANRYAPLDDITVVGSDDPLLLGDGGGRIKL